MGIRVKEIPLGSGKWYVVINHKKRRKTKLIGTEEEAEEVKLELEWALRREGISALDTLTPKKEPIEAIIPAVKEYAEKWLGEIKKTDLKLSTLNSYESNLRYHLLPAFGHLRLDEITYSELKDFILRKIEKYTKDSVRLMVATLRVMLNEAMEDRLLSRNPVHEKSP